MNWFFIALLAPVLWSVGNHMDKFIVGKYFKKTGPGAMVIFFSLAGLLVFPPVLAFYPTVLKIDIVSALVMVLAGFVYCYGIIPYLHALSKDEASRVIPLFQMGPVFHYFNGLVFLGEVLSVSQIIGAVLIIGGAVILSSELGKGSISLKKDVLGLMVLASITFSANALLFKVAAIGADFWTTVFWQYLGYFVAGMLLLVFHKSYRQQFLSVVKVNKIPVLSLVSLDVGLSTVGRLCYYFATTLAPLALVSTVNGFQPLFIFLFGVILTLFFPHLGTESMLKKHIYQKIASIIVIFTGVYLILR